MGDAGTSSLVACDLSLSFVCEYMQKPIIAKVTPMVILTVNAFFSPEARTTARLGHSVLHSKPYSL